MTNLIQTSGELFNAVQEAYIFPDSKTFVDCIPLRSPELILNDYICLRSSAEFDLQQFVLQNFKMNEPVTKNLALPKNCNMKDHINYLWDILTRHADIPNQNSSLLALPYPYIVPGGRFSEIYYWDSYFTAEGLAVSGHLNMVQNMLDNFVNLIDTIGHIPNGNRAYYKSRSQPPFFCSMVNILYRYQGISAIKKYLPKIEAEYNFWMSGNRAVQLEKYTLNRYWDNEAAPRPESYREDVELAHYHDDKARFYRNIRAAAESGWDFSSRWFADGQNLVSINITDLLPVDLNSILYGVETMLALWFAELGNIEKSELYTKYSTIRMEAINKYFWDNEQGFYFDYNFVQQQRTPQWSAAAVYPLFFRVSDTNQAQSVAKHIEEKFVQVGGLLTTLNITNEQWDSPNGWAPLQWLAINGLNNYGHKNLATLIKDRFINNVQNIFLRTGKLMEKYNVCDISVNATGGEYPLQDGFGWTNGIVITLLKSDL